MRMRNFMERIDELIAHVKSESAKHLLTSEQADKIVAMSMVIVAISCLRPRVTAGKGCGNESIAFSTLAARRVPSARVGPLRSA